MNMPTHPKTVRGFSIIEMIVSISIIGILIALLLPSLGAARHSAWTTTSGANLRQLGFAIEIYQTEHDGALPYFRSGVGSDPSIGRATMSIALGPYVESDDVYYAPADPVIRNRMQDERFEYSSYDYVPGELMHFAEPSRSSPLDVQDRVRSLYQLKGGTVFIERASWAGRFGGDGRLEVSLPDWAVSQANNDPDERHPTGYRPRN